MTLRDETWNAALELLAAEGEFRVTELLDEAGLTERQRATVLRCLRELEDHGWLARESKQSGIWRAGEKGRVLLNSSPYSETEDSNGKDTDTDDDRAVVEA